MKRQVLVPAAALVVFALAWEFLVWVNGWPDYKMASPSDLGPAFWKFRGLFLEHGWETLWRTVAMPFSKEDLRSASGSFGLGTNVARPPLYGTPCS